MLRLRYLGGWFGLVALAALSSSCDDKVCTKGRSECLAGNLVRTCIPGEDDNQWFTHQCQPDEHCEDRGPSMAGDGVDVSTAAQTTGDGGLVTTLMGGAVCAGTCDIGASECASSVLARHCVDGRAWQLAPCDPGQLCVDGVCRIVNDGGLRICDADQRSCASREVERVCAADGSGWVETTCEEAEACLVDRCAPDPDASCDEASRCLDDKTALRCLGEAEGFEVVDCANDNWCEAGRCRGSVCVLGSVCSAANQVRHCIDGETLEDEQCAVNEVCKQERDHASCVPRVCVPGTTVCGDPRDQAVDDTKFYSRCAPGTETLSGVPEWVVTECKDLLTCDPVLAAFGTPCQQNCTPGAEACAAHVASGVSDGWTVCDDTGNWGPVERCDAGTGRRLLCAIEYTPDASVLPTHVCAEPVCAWVIENQAAEGGSCEQTQVQTCDKDGRLTDAADCDVGICRPTSVLVQDDGRVPGACDEDLECAKGEERCVYDGLLPTPLFQVCEDTLWSARLRACAGDVPCLDWIDQDGLSNKLCGVECAPGHRQCNANGRLQTCNAKGEWGATETCDVGTCQAIGATDAACVLDCTPGMRVCSGAIVTASDGVSTGTTEERRCDADGLLGPPEVCAAGETCRVSRLGEHLGCVACVGSDVLGGNLLGYADTRCDPSDVDRVQECGPGNTWNASRACTGTKHCIGPEPDRCGMCLSDAGNSVVCTQTNVNEEGICGPCSHANLSMTLPNCRNSLIMADTAAADGGTMDTCDSLFGDDPANGDTSGYVSWGGFNDCCDGAPGANPEGQFLVDNTCSSLGYLFPSAWGGYPDCCFTARLTASGPDFAYCGE